MKISTNVMMRRRMAWQDVARGTAEWVATLTVAMWVAWAVVDALFPNTPL